MVQPKKPVKVVEKKTTKVTTKPTTKPKAKTVSQRIGDITLRDVKDAGETALNLSTLGGYGVAKRKIKELMNNKNGGTTMKKAKSGLGMKSVKSGYDNNSGVTRADFVAIGKGTAKSGAKMAKQAAVAIAMKKAGKTPKKAMSGYGGKAASMAPMKNGGKMKKAQTGTAQKQMDSNVSQLAMKNAAGSLMTAGKAKSGKSMKKCKYGCK
jgi:hypothetical protein